jgi:hypothetical protein
MSAKADIPIEVGNFAPGIVQALTVSMITTRPEQRRHAKVASWHV